MEFRTEHESTPITIGMRTALPAGLSAQAWQEAFKISFIY